MAGIPSIKDRALEKLASNSRWQTTMISSLADQPLADRLVLRLLELVDSSPQRRAGLSVTPKVSQSTLAAMVGVSRENVNRALAALVGQRFDPPGEGSVRAGRRGAAAPARSPGTGRWWPAPAATAAATGDGVPRRHTSDE